MICYDLKFVAFLFFLQYYAAARDVKPYRRFTCKQGQIYTNLDVTCICTRRGYWPHSNCEIIFEYDTADYDYKDDHSFRASLRTEDMRCVPNQYLVVGCDICYCGPDGRINKDQCTRHLCETEDTPLFLSRKSSRSKINTVYNECEKGTWYSIGPCQYCYCVNKNKLLCNLEHHDNKTLEIGKYNMHNCGKGFLQDAFKLMNQEGGDEIVVKSKLNHEKPDLFKSSSELPRGCEDTNVHSTKNKDTYRELEDTSDIEESDNEDNDKNHINQFDEDEPFLSFKEDLGSTFKFKIPKMLDDVLKLAFRKSALSIRSDIECIPGSVINTVCSKCYCLGNGKELCSNLC